MMPVDTEFTRRTGRLTPWRRLRFTHQRVRRLNRIEKQRNFIALPEREDVRIGLFGQRRFNTLKLNAENILVQAIAHAKRRGGSYDLPRREGQSIFTLQIDDTIGSRRKGPRPVALVCHRTAGDIFGSYLVKSSRFIWINSIIDIQAS